LKSLYFVLKNGSRQVWWARSSSGILMRGTLQKGFHGVVKDAFYHPSRTCGRPKKRNLSVPFCIIYQKSSFLSTLNIFSFMN